MGDAWNHENKKMAHFNKILMNGRVYQIFEKKFDQKYSLRKSLLKENAFLEI